MLLTSRDHSESRGEPDLEPPYSSGPSREPAEPVSLDEGSWKTAIDAGASGAKAPAQRACTPLADRAQPFAAFGFIGVTDLLSLDGRWGPFVEFYVALARPALRRQTPYLDFAGSSASAAGRRP